MQRLIGGERNYLPPQRAHPIFSVNHCHHGHRGNGLQVAPLSGHCCVIQVCTLEWILQVCRLKAKDEKEWKGNADDSATVTLTFEFIFLNKV